MPVALELAELYGIHPQEVYTKPKRQTDLGILDVRLQNSVVPVELRAFPAGLAL